MDISFVSAAISFVSGVLGVGVAWGGLRVGVKNNTDDIIELKRDFDALTGQPAGEPVYIRRVECDDKQNDMSKQIETLKAASHGIEKYARYMLTKDGLSLSEVNDILGNE